MSNDANETPKRGRIDWEEKYRADAARQLLEELEALQYDWRIRCTPEGYEEAYSCWVDDRKDEILAQLKRCYKLIDSVNTRMKRTREKVLDNQLDWDDPLFQEVADVLLALD